MIHRKIRRAIEKAVAPKANISYAQAGEDLVLDFLCDYRPTGFYVDVGCNHPVRGSNTYRFYRKGWQGICVDAASKFAPMFSRSRPRDKFVRAAISDTAGSVQFNHFAQDELSSIGGERLADLAGYELKFVETIETETLSAVLEEQGCPREFDFLSLDVEGHDEPALRSLDLASFRPRIILTELNGTDLNIGRVEDHSVSRHLAEFGYTPIAVHWGNVFYRRG